MNFCIKAGGGRCVGQSCIILRVIGQSSGIGCRRREKKKAADNCEGYELDNLVGTCNEFSLGFVGLTAPQATLLEMPCGGRAHEARAQKGGLGWRYRWRSHHHADDSYNYLPTF